MEFTVNAKELSTKACKFKNCNFKLFAQVKTDQQ